MANAFASSHFLLVVLFLAPVFFTAPARAEIDPWYQVSKHTDLSEHQPACDHKIYCQGRLLEAVNGLGLFNDTKVFVDMPLKSSPDEVLAKFNTQFPTEDLLTKDAVQKFVDENFGAPYTELKNCTLDDYRAGEVPPRLSTIKDKRLREFAIELHDRWHTLCRQVKDDVRENFERYSAIYIPGNFIVPGERFQEVYYWDSYFTIQGLLASGLTDTVRSILNTLIYLVNHYGFVPNGARIYYLKRSQPPLLTGMFYEYFQATNDYDFIAENIGVLEKELAWWQDNRTLNLSINGHNYQLFQYRADSDMPRPESFRADTVLVNETNWEDRYEIWRNLASAAEAGWDFSSRWFKDGKNLKTIETTNVVEVDLNAFMCWNYNLMRYFYSLLSAKNESYRAKENEYARKHFHFRRNFQKAFYVEEHAGWYDFNTRTEKHNTHFFASNAVPLFTRCYDRLNHQQIEKMYHKMYQDHVFRDRGVPTSLTNTSEQWDFPNAWPPLQMMLIDGMRLSESARLQEAAFQLAQRWIRLNYEEYYRTDQKNMWEKYNLIEKAKGEGGEYYVQKGFGWTNGVVLDLLVKYGSRLNSSEFAGKEEPLPPPDAFDDDLPDYTHHREKIIYFFGYGVPVTIVALVIVFLLVCSLAKCFLC